MVEFNDPEVQIVYELLCDTAETPPEGEHYEGWVARRIVAALRAKHAQQRKTFPPIDRDVPAFP